MVVDTVTSEPFVSRASTLACAAYVVLNTATASANEADSAISVVARDRRLRCRDIDAATTPESRPANGAESFAMTPRPCASAILASRHVRSTAPIQSRSGARRVEVLTEIVGTPSGASTT